MSQRYYTNTASVFKKGIVDKLARRSGVMRFEQSNVIDYTQKIGVEFLETVLFRAYQYNDFLKKESMKDDKNASDGAYLDLISVILALRSSKFNIQMVAGSQSLQNKGKLIKMSGGGDKHKMKGGAGGGTNVKIAKKIKDLQERKDLLTEKAPFTRLVKEIITKFLYKDGPKLRIETLSALHHALEGYLCKLFRDAQLLAIHSNRRQVNAKDMAIVRLTRGEIFKMDIDN